MLSIPVDRLNIPIPRGLLPLDDLLLVDLTLRAEALDLLPLRAFTPDVRFPLGLN